MANKKKTNKKSINNVNNDVSPIMMTAILIIFIIAMIFVTYFGMHLSSPVSKYFSQYNEKLDNKLGAILKQQKEMDQKIKDLSVNGNYKIEEPLVIRNPYSINPLTAVVIFNTDEDSRVEVNINGEVKTNMERSKNHIIPIYGLYADAVNSVTITIEDGRSYSFDLPIEAFDNNIYSFDISSQIGTSDIYYMAGNVNDYKSNLRGFDRLGNLISYLSLDYIGGFTLYKNKIAIAYNSNKDVPNDLRLDIDYLGRISYITSNTNDIKYEPNISGDAIDFIGASHNLYNELTGNYSMPDVVSNDSYDTSIDLDINEYEDKLTSADTYKGEYKVSYMADFIAYKIDHEGKLLVVTNEGNLKQYDMSTKGIIRTDIKGNKALYVSIDGNIYSLKTTLND